MCVHVCVYVCSSSGAKLLCDEVVDQRSKKPKPDPPIEKHPEECRRMMKMEPPECLARWMCVKEMDHPCLYAQEECFAHWMSAKQINASKFVSPTPQRSIFLDVY